MDLHFALMAVLVFWVAMLYASVGHGGASGYQAVLSLFAVPVRVMASTALCLNILVAGIAAVNYVRAGHFSGRLTWPFVLASIPAAFIGGLVVIPERVYGLLLALVLGFASWQLGFGSQGLCVPNQDASALKPIGTGIALFWGGLIGLLSGMLGIGGGIFLSPLMLLMRWSNAKQAAAASAVFIVVNAISGLTGRLVSHNLAVGNLWLLVPVAGIGGLVGSYLGACRFSNLGLRRLLSAVLLLAASKLLWSFF